MQTTSSSSNCAVVVVVAASNIFDGAVGVIGFRGRKYHYTVLLLLPDPVSHNIPSILHNTPTKRVNKYTNTYSGFMHESAIVHVPFAFAFSRSLVQSFAFTYDANAMFFLFVVLSETYL